MAKINEFPQEWQNRDYQIFDGTQIIQDAWRFIPESSNDNGDDNDAKDDILAASDLNNALLPLTTWLNIDPVEQRPKGFWLRPDTDILNWHLDLSDIELIGIAFHRPVDGRGYSIARLLREQHGFDGTLRAVGQIRLDQLAYMRQVGFDEFALKESASLETAIRTINSVPHPYMRYAKGEMAASNQFQQRHQ